MSKIRFRKRVQIDGDQNLYARNPLNPAEFIIVGNLKGTTEVTAPVTLDKTIRYRKTIRIDENDDLYIRVGDTFVDIGNAKGASTESWLDFEEQVVSTLKASIATLSSSYTSNKLTITGAKIEWGTSKNDSAIYVDIDELTSPLTTKLTGLSSNTTYYFRTVITTTESGEFISEWAEFETGSNDIVYGTQEAIDVSATSATLNSAYTHNGAVITGVKLQYTNSIEPEGEINNVEGAETDVTETDGTISGTVSGLTSGTDYYFRGVVTCEGKDIVGEWVKFTTGLPDIVFVNQVATAVSASSATLEFGYSLHNESSILGRKLQFGTSKNGPLTDVIITEPINYYLETTLTGLTSDTTYYVKAVITTASGEFISEWAEFETGSNDIVYGTQEAIDVSATSATLFFQFTHNGAVITEPKLQYTDSIEPEGEIHDVEGAEIIVEKTYGEITGTVSGLTSGTDYYFRGVVTCEGKDIVGEWVKFTTGLPDIVFVNQVATAVSETSVTLNSEYTLNNESSIDEAKLQWGTSKTDPLTDVVIAEPTSPLTTNLTGLSPETTYYFRTVITTESEEFTSEWTEFTTLAG